MVLAHWYKQGKRREGSQLPSALSLHCPFCTWKILCFPCLHRVGIMVKYVLPDLFALHSNESVPEGQPHHHASVVQTEYLIWAFSKTIWASFFWLLEQPFSSHWLYRHPEALVLLLSWNSGIRTFQLTSLQWMLLLFCQILWFWCLVFNISHIRHNLLYVEDISALISVVGSFQ